MKLFRSGRRKIRIILPAVIILLFFVIAGGYHFIKLSYSDPVVMEVGIESEKVTESIILVNENNRCFID